MMRRRDFLRALLGAPLMGVAAAAALDEEGAAAEEEMPSGTITHDTADHGWFVVRAGGAGPHDRYYVEMARALADKLDEDIMRMYLSG